MIIRGLKIITRQLFYLSIIAAVLIILLIASIYWLSNAVEQRRDEIAQWVGDEIGYPVKIGEASLDWIDFSPKLQIGDVALLSEDSQKELVVLGSLYLGLDLISSIKAREPVLNDISLSKLKLMVVRDYAGQFQLQDITLTNTSSEQNIDWKSWIHLLNKFNFDQIKIDYTDSLNAALSGQYEVVEGALTHKDHAWTLQGSITPPSLVADTIVIDAKLDMNDDAFETSSWQVKTKINNLQAASLAEGIVWQDIQALKGTLSTQITATGKGMQLDSISSDINLSHATFMGKSNDSPAVELDALIGTVDWKKDEELWGVSGQVTLSINGDDWPETAFTINKNVDNSWQVMMQYLRLRDLTALALLSNKTPEIIVKQLPSGDIKDLNFHYSADDGLSALSFDLHDATILPWQDYPGVSNLTAKLNWKDSLARLSLNSREMTVDAKPWLDETVLFNSMAGTLQLEYSQEKWKITSQELKVSNDDLTIQLDGEVHKTHDGKIINDLVVKLDNVAVNQWKKYVPRKNLSVDFKKWSDDAFVAGKITTGEIMLKGDLAAFPYEKEPGKGQFKMTLQAEGVQLHYAPGWPDLTGLTGTITGSGNDLIIKTKVGQTAGFDFIDVTTIITKLTERKPILRVNGEVKGTTAKALQFLSDSPLRKRFGVVADEAVAKGNSHINLDLMVPLANVDNTTVSGYVSFLNSQLNYKASPKIGISQINGDLYFSEKGIKAKDIKATAFNEAILINVKPEGDKAIVSISSHISSDVINKTWFNSLPSFITGRAAYQLDLTVVERELGEFYLDMDFSSDLEGVALAMPTPIGKKESQKTPFKASMQNIDGGLVYKVKYGDVLNAIAKPKGELWKGEVRFGKGQATLPKNGIKLSGQLNELSVDDWMSWSKLQNSNGTSIANSIDDISIALAKVHVFDQTVSNLNLASQKDASGWRINIDSDQARGFVYLPDDLTGSAGIKVNLERLVFSFPEKVVTMSPEHVQTKALWPSIDVSIGSLLLDEQVLGKLTLNAKRAQNKWVISLAELVSDTFTLSASQGEWSKTSATGKTTIQLQLVSKDIDLLLADFGFQKTIDAENLTMKANLSWPNSPLDFGFNVLSGTFNMDVGKGKLHDLEPGAAGRIFGLMSIAALPRRLSLDFNDLFGKGFNFDSITGDFQLNNGIANTSNFMLASASAEVEITGTVDLIKQQYNQQVIVTPNVSSTLPIAGAVAGGPVGLGVGTAVLLVDKLTDKIFDKKVVNVISYKYDLTGPWAQPAVTKTKAQQAKEHNQHPQNKLFQ